MKSNSWSAYFWLFIFYFVISYNGYGQGPSFAKKDSSTHTVTFEIEDEEGEPITHAQITFGEVNNDAGNYVFEVEPNTYNYSIYASGFSPINASIEVTQDVVIPVVMQDTDQDYSLQFNQPYWDGGTAITSVIDDSSTMDYELADNFWNVEAGIEQMVFFGLAMKLVNGYWVEQTPDANEPFIIRFYNYELDGGLLAPSTGTYKLALLDSYGDGWNGGVVAVYLNGVAVLENITLAFGPGPVYHNFTANQGDEITTIYTSGSWAAENYYAILDPSDSVIAEQGGTWSNPGASVPGNISQGDPLEPDWADPLSVHNLMAEIENIGTIWDDNAYTLYKFTVNFSEPVFMQNGWVSVQIDANTGSGTWFMWLNSQAGDQLSWHRLAPKKDNVLTREVQASLLLDPQTKTPKDQRNEDVAFEFWGNQLPGQLFTLTFVILDEDNNPISDAVITLENETNEAGNYVFEGLLQGSYNYTIEKEGFVNAAGEVVVVDEDLTITVVLETVTVESVTFNVNMTYAEDFDPATDLVYFTGSIFGWATPGDQPEDQTMTRVDDSMVWTKTIELEAGTYAYKYFLNAGWDGGEWQGGDDRELVVEDDMEVNDWFGYLTDPTTVTDPSLEQIRVFPVPARTTLYVTSPETIREVRIIDMLGQIAYTSSIADLRHEVNTGSFKNGIYFIQIFTEKGIETRRIQVQK